jgi:hypothetical protein
MMIFAMARPSHTSPRDHRRRAGRREEAMLPCRAPAPHAAGSMDALPLALPPWPGLLWLIGGALAGGLARGFSGFGAALIFVPLAAVAVGPQQAAPLMMAVEVIALASLTLPAWRIADRREIGLLTLGAAFGFPTGAAILRAGEPTALRWGIALTILALLLLLVSGWRFRGRPTRPLTVGVGVAGGVLGGVAMVSGPPVMAYLLGREMPAREVRAAFTLYLGAGTVLAALAYAALGMLSTALLAPFLVTAPAYALGIWGGARLFGLASEVAFRRACYAMIALAALLSLPALDGWLR